MAQEDNAEKALEELQNFSAEHAQVIRNGKKILIDANDLVVGDILFLQAGDKVPGDGRIIKNYDLLVDESSLTGESLPINKTDKILNKEVPLGDQKNMVFSGTICLGGRAEVCITAVGEYTELGKIASIIREGEKEQTPLQIKLSQVSKIIGILCIGICILVFILEVVSGLSILNAFKTSIALAVAAIPEGLATVVTICLALGVSRMAKKNAVVKKLPAVETLGCCSIICSDKTGTLTQNKMTVVETFSSDDDKDMITYFALCCDATVTMGDPTEIAIIKKFEEHGIKKENLDEEFPRLKEIAFDSSRKMMTVFVPVKNKILQITKGAPDVILSRSINNTYYNVNSEMANKALRVLAVAIKWYDKLPINMSDVENDMIFKGFVGMIDPPREEVKTAIKEAKQGGIRTIMITGDHLDTAKAIGRELGILRPEDMAITGAELTEDILNNDLEKISIYARVAPEHKVQIVEAWKNRGHIVAMTGDGVNDSPALKIADIGCAMGLEGTSVARQSAEMVLMDDNFATILGAVKEGRNIYLNVKKNVQFLLSSNIGEVWTILCASILNLIPGFNLQTPLLPIHLLWVNLITDSLPAFALSMEEAEDDIMYQTPRDKKESFFANGLGFKIAWQGILIGLITLVSYLYGNSINHSIGMTMAFLTLSGTQLIHAFNIKSNHSILNKTILNNKYLLGSLMIGLLLQLSIVYIQPLASLFSLTALSTTQLSISLGLALVPLIIVECLKKLKAY